MHVPSPKKLTDTASAVSSPRTSRRYLIANAAPRPMGMPSPMNAKPPSRPCSLENMCIDPPCPRQMPVFLPKSSAMISRAGTFLDRACTWSRLVELMKSSLRRRLEGGRGREGVDGRDVERSLALSSLSPLFLPHRITPVDTASWPE